MRTKLIMLSFLVLSPLASGQDRAASLGDRALAKFTDVLLERAFNAMLDDLTANRSPRPPPAYFDQLTEAFTASLAVSFASTYHHCTMLFMIEERQGMEEYRDSQGEKKVPVKLSWNDMVPKKEMANQYRLLSESSVLLRDRLETMRTSVAKSAEWNQRLYQFQLYFHLLHKTIEYRSAWRAVEDQIDKDHEAERKKAFDNWWDTKELLTKIATELNQWRPTK
jgi:hypothetical protein